MSEKLAPIVIGTIGHIDHAKVALTAALSKIGVERMVIVSDSTPETIDVQVALRQIELHAVTEVPTEIRYREIERPYGKKYRRHNK